MPDTQKTYQKAVKKDHDYVTILGIRVSSTPHDKLLKLVQEKLEKRQHFYIVTPNPEIIYQAQTNPKLTHSLNSADFSLPDGVGLKLAAKNLQIIKGRNFMLDLFDWANTHKRKIYLFGSTKDVIKKSLAKISKEYGDIIIKGESGPKFNEECNPISEVDTSLEFDIVKEINTFKPDLLFVALGAPKQELWIAKWQSKLQAIGIMAVGGSLDYYSEKVKPVPGPIEYLNLEWLWRLIQEPRRLGRIVDAFILFPIQVFREKYH